MTRTAIKKAPDYRLCFGPQRRRFCSQWVDEGGGTGGGALIWVACLSTNASAAAISPPAGGRPNASRYAIRTNFALSLPHSASSLPLQRRAACSVISLFNSSKACGAVVVFVRRGQLFN